MSDVSKTNELIAEARRQVGRIDDKSMRERLISDLADALEAATRVPVQGEPNDDREALCNILLDSRESGEGLSALSERIMAAGFSRATVPDAATELAAIKARSEEVGEDEGWHIGGAWGDYGEVVVPLRILSYVVDGALDEKIVSTDPGYAATYAEQIARADRAEAERAAALAAIERVRAIHEKSLFDGGECLECDLPWPCLTVAALDGAPEPEAVEWEYAVGGMNPGSTEAWAHDKDDISSNFDTARAWTDEAIASGSFSNAIVVKRRVNPWLPVEGEKP